MLLVSFREDTAFRPGTEDHWPMDFLVPRAGTKLLSSGERRKTLLLSLSLMPLLLFGLVL